MRRRCTSAKGEDRVRTQAHARPYRGWRPEFKETAVKDLFQHVLEHEKGVTKSIHEIMAMAIEEKDYATQILDQWYVDEQIEEEKNITEILQTIELVGNTPQGVFLLNIELGKRKLGVPSNFTEMGGGE